MHKEMEAQPLQLAKMRFDSGDGPFIFAGSGDSYAAGLAAQYCSGGSCVCHSPSELLACPSLLKSSLCIVSISGKTASNIRLAQLARQRGFQTTAVTTNPSSPLAAECDRTVLLEIQRPGIPAAGTLSFTSALLACCGLAGKYSPAAAIDALYEQSAKEASRFFEEQGVLGHPFFLGEGIHYPVALYAAMKFEEVLGQQASGYPTDEFCHSPIFGLQEKCRVIILGGPSSEGFSNIAQAAGIAAWKLNVQEELCLVDRALFSSFFVQRLVIESAKAKGLKECYFLANKKLLDVSSAMIY